jgi:hypothetical protein
VGPVLKRWSFIKEYVQRGSGASCLHLCDRGRFLALGVYIGARVIGHPQAAAFDHAAGISGGNERPRGWDDGEDVGAR